MTKINFYIINETEKNDALRFVCRLIEKMPLKNQKIYVHCDDHFSVQFFNDLLWTFHDISFIPHEIVGENKQTSIHIGYQEKPSETSDVLINLSSKIPLFYKEFGNIIEIVPEIEDWKNFSRMKYQTYKKNGDDLQTIKPTPKNSVL